MGLIFDNDLHDEFGSSPLAYAPYGGADFGEVLAIARAVGNGDDNAFYDCWMTAADRLVSEAESAMAQGRRASARDLFLRASCFYSSSYRPLYGEPVDPRLVAAFRKQIDTFNKGLALFEIPIEPVRIQFEGATLPAYLIPAIGQQDDPRPLLIQTNGYDATVTDMYFGSAVAASRRGYHCLIFDGPGQGEMLIEHGVRLRPDWETVVRAVVDVAVTTPIVDSTRIALSGWSLGGYLAPRAASGEHRLAACIADPGLWSIASGLRGYAVKLGVSPEALVNIGEMDEDLLNRMWQIITNDRRLRWSIVQRGFWVNGVKNFRDYLRCVEEFTMDGRADQIRCPMLLTQAEDDPLAAGAQAFFDALCCPKNFVRFTSAEGAGDHCEMKNRSLLNRRVFDWLDATLSRE
jgi:alpha-beta hydrolase superfamily lysophospholipase